MTSYPIIITGATGSMGSVAARSLTSRGIPVILACRNLKKGDALLQSILQDNPSAQVELLELELSSRKSVRSFVKTIGDRKLGGLFNNAGVMNRYYALGEDGLEHTMSVNYLNVVLLTRLLADNFVDGAHIVNMVSLTCKLYSVNTDWPSLGEKDFGQIKTYGMSKAAMLYFSIAFARKYPHLHVNVSDPGIVDSNMIHMGRWFDPLADAIFRPLINSPEKGARPALRALESSESLLYYVGKRSNPIPHHFLDSSLPEALWDQSTELLGL